MVMKIMQNKYMKHLQDRMPENDQRWNKMTEMKPLRIECLKMTKCRKND